MAWVNFHSHSQYCDGKSPIEDHVKAAIQQGLFALGISSHAPVPFDNLWSMKSERLPDYLEDIEKLSTKYGSAIELYKGLEIDYIPGKVGPSSKFIKDAHLDFTIGSIHFVGCFENGKDWPIDGPNSDFDSGLHQIYNGEMKRVVQKYFQLTRELINTERPDIIGHMDKIKMHGQSRHGFSEHLPWYRDEIMFTLETIQKSNIVMEINTRGMYKKKMKEPYPSWWVIEESKRMNIPLMINSDSHTPAELTNEFRTVSRKLSSIGYKTLRILTLTGWKDMEFNETGLIR